MRIYIGADHRGDQLACEPNRRNRYAEANDDL